MQKRLRAALVTTGIALIAWGAALQARGRARLRAVNHEARPTEKPRIFAHVFASTADEVQNESESLQQSLLNQGVPIEGDWLDRFTYGRGGGPGLGPLIIPVAVAVTVASWYAQGFVGSIGADHAKAIKETIGEWLAQRKADEFYFCLLSATGQQVRASFPSDPVAFREAWDALDSALMSLPELAPESNCLLEWDASAHRWTLPLG